jgi:hypothetical protein
LLLNAIEVWRVVPSVPTLAASSLGRIKVLPYVVKGHTYEGKPRVGKLHDGRLHFVHRRKSYMVHRLVCEAFHGSPPAGRPNCLHDDEDSLNNRASNLHWGTQKENLNAPGFIAYCKTRTGDNHPRAKARARA